MQKKSTYIPPTTSEVRQDHDAILCASASSASSDFDDLVFQELSEE